MKLANDIKPIVNMENHSIYELYSDNLILYYAAIPNLGSPIYQVFVSFPNIDLDSASIDSITNEINTISNFINEKHNNGICIIPNIKPSELTNASLQNDSFNYKYIYDKLMSVLSNFNKISKDIKLEQVICFLKQTDSEIKFIDWLELSLGGQYITSITYSDPGQGRINTGGGDSLTNSTPTLNNIKVKTLKKPSSNHGGFGNIILILLTLVISMAFGIVIATLLIK